MGRKVFSLICVLSSLVLLLGAPAGFARTDPGQPWGPPERGRSHELPQRYVERGLSLPRQPAGGSQSPAQPLGLGQPGLSFGYVGMYGETQLPYPADSIHLNRPYGLFMDANDNLYVTEDRGCRILKYNSAGGNVMEIGLAGFCITGDDTFNRPVDVVVDSLGNIWAADSNRVVKFNAGGGFLLSLPTENSWEEGDDNTHFRRASGIALDGTGRLFVADRNNHRIQVYNISSGDPVYQATIGTTGVWGTGPNQFDGPTRLAVDSSNRLYVVDQWNGRVQRCTYSAGWSCTTFDGDLEDPQGVTVDAAGNVYIANGWTGWVRKCPAGGACSDFSQYWGVLDVAVDSDGNIFTANTWESVVHKFDSNGDYVDVFLGEEYVPYLTDNYHYFYPHIALDRQDNLIIAEELGQRVVKLNKNGEFLWSFGQSGIDSDDNQHLIWPMAVDTDANNKVYVASDYRVMILSANGAYEASIGTGYGNGNYQFNWVTGVAVGPDGKIYITDGPNHRVQVYSPSRTYLATIGVNGVPGSDNGHFDYPARMDVDAAGNIYVADWNNCRVQKFNANRQYLLTFGRLGSCTDDLQDVGPEDVEVDAQGRVYIGGWDNRITVFDAAGNYLTTIAGSWGVKTSQNIGVGGVGIDSQGTVYLADMNNARILKYAPGVPRWTQRNLNGFGERWNEGVTSFEEFNGQLYAAATNWTDGARVYRSDDGLEWSPVSANGFSAVYGAENAMMPDLVEFNGNLYASTGWGGGAGQIWRSANGTGWTPVTEDGFGDTDIGAFTTFIVSDGWLYVGASNETTGVQIWRSDTGDSGDWDQVAANGLGDADNFNLTGFAEFGGNLYASIENNNDGMEVWRSSGGAVWAPAAEGGFGNLDNVHSSSFAILDGFLYVGTRNEATGAEVWRSDDGDSWTPVVDGGFGDANNLKIEAMAAFDGALYAGTNNLETGTEVWRSTDGLTWTQINPDGFGDSNNEIIFWAHGMRVMRDNLYMGTFNWGNGGEIWVYQDDAVYLPLMTR